jgi:hypothetical protein
MQDSSPSFDASKSALGYLHQCRCALLLALQRDDFPEHAISIEKFDDISVHDPNSPNSTVVELRQHKLHVSRQGNLGDKSVDVWKTLRVWAESVAAKRMDLDRVQLCLVTTSRANDSNAIRWLRPATDSRNSEEARKRLEQAGAESTNKIVSNACKVFMQLDDGRRKKLFASISLLDGGLDAIEVRGAMNRCVWSACIEKHRSAFLDRLEGWWINQVVLHLFDPNPVPIPIFVVQQQVHEISASFRRGTLPDNLLNEPVPYMSVEDTTETNFVRQLSLLGISQVRIQMALEDHYRAFTQRSKWAKEHLLNFDEEVNYESRLMVGWKERFLIMAEGLLAGCDDPTLAKHGSKLYEWIVTEAPSKSQLWFRPDFQSEYMTKGSYHMLSDQLRVGWHPEYESRLAPPPPTSKGKSPKKRRRNSK